MTKQKPWPTDAIMLVCSTPETATREHMDSVNDGTCRDCGQAIVYSGRSMRFCLETPGRGDRPVRFFCIDCATQHRFEDITHFEDHRGGGRVVQTA